VENKLATNSPLRPAKNEVALIEWPQRVGMDVMPRDRLDLHWTTIDDQHPTPSYRRNETDRRPPEEEEENQKRRVWYIYLCPLWLLLSTNTCSGGD
jgi:tRNA A37 threonylcarbamoyladenosine biosynthesis protein TsaE